MVDRKESAADIVINVDEAELTVESLSVSKDIDIETIYGSGKTLPDGYAINQISYEGDFTLKGNKTDLEGRFFDPSTGIPKIVDAIVITHLDGSSTSYQELLCRNSGYEVNSGETTETTFEFVAMKKSRDGVSESN